MTLFDRRYWGDQRDIYCPPEPPPQPVDLVAQLDEQLAKIPPREVCEPFAAWSCDWPEDITEPVLTP